MRKFLLFIFLIVVSRCNAENEGIKDALKINDELLSIENALIPGVTSITDFLSRSLSSLRLNIQFSSFATEQDAKEFYEKLDDLLLSDLGRFDRIQKAISQAQKCIQSALLQLNRAESSLRTKVRPEDRDKLLKLDTNYQQLIKNNEINNIL